MILWGVDVDWGIGTAFLILFSNLAMSVLSFIPIQHLPFVTRAFRLGFRWLLF